MQYQTLNQPLCTAYHSVSETKSHPNSEEARKEVIQKYKMPLTLTSCVITYAICFGIFRMMKWYSQRRRLYKLASKFEGPPVLPFLGNAHLFVGNGEHVLNKLNECNNSYPSPCRLWLGPALWFGISDAEQIKTVCLSPKLLEKGYAFAHFSQPLLGSGLLTAPVEIWKVHRKLIQPTFNMKILEFYVEVFATQSRILTAQMTRYLDGPEFEIYDAISLCTLDMICETAMGIKIGGQTNRTHPYLVAEEKVIPTARRRIFTPWMYPDFIFKRTQLGKYQQKHVGIMRDFTEDVINMRRNKICESKSHPCAADNADGVRESTTRGKRFLDLLLELPHGSSNLSDRALSDEVSTMILAGNETVGLGCLFAMLMLASHPDVQEKVHQELYEIYGDDDIEEHPVTPKDLPRMKYLERVIKETLRLFPTVPYIIRSVTEDFKIDDRILPTGSSIVIGILPLQRKKEYWPDPLKFDPDRFLPEEVAKRHPYAYMAFSGGSRNCIGLTYALMSMKTLLATVLRRYILKKDDILPVKDIRLRTELVLKPEVPIKLRIERQTKNLYAFSRSSVTL